MSRPKRNADSPDEQVRELMLRRAAELFNRKGYATATVREIVAAAGVSKPVLYYYFGNKEGIYHEMMRLPFEKLDALLQGFHEVGGRASEKLLSLFEHIFALFCENIPAARIMYSTYYGAPQGAPFFDFEAYHKKFLGALRLLVEEGVQNGEFRMGCVGDAVWAIIGALNVAVEVQLSHPEKPIGWEGLSRILRLVFRGISAQPDKGEAC